MSQIINWIRSGGNNASNAQTIVYTREDGFNSVGESLLAAWSSKWSGPKTRDDRFDYIYDNFSFADQYDMLIDLGSIYGYDMKPLEDEINSILFEYLSVDIETTTLEITDPKAFAVMVATEMAKEYGKQLDEIVLLRVIPYFHRGRRISEKELIIFIDQTGDLRGGYYFDSLKLDLTTPEAFVSNFVN